MKQTVTFTKTDLRAKGACSSGIKTFQDIIGKNKRAFTYSPDDVLFALQIRVSYGANVNWLERRGIVPRLYVNEATIKGVDAKKLVATGASLRLITLDTVDLTYADMSASCFDACVIKDSNLSNARFIRARFMNGTLMDSKFEKTDFAHATFRDVYFRRFNAPKTSFYNSFFDGAHFNVIDFNEVNFKFAIFRDCHFTNCSFKGAQLAGATFVDCFFNDDDGSVLSGALRFKTDRPLPGYRTKKYKPDPDYYELVKKEPRPSK